MNFKIAAGVTFVVAIYAGLMLGDASWQGTVFVTDGMYNSDASARVPAAIRQVLDISNLEGSALTSAMPSRLLHDVRVVSSANQGIGIELGHFVTRDDAGEKVFACGYFTRIELKFVADGVIEGGERPTMTVEGPCTYKNNINRIDPIWIPVAKILAEAPGQTDITSEDADGASLHFQDVGGIWPKNWSLYTIRLYDQDNQAHEALINETEMRKQLSKLLAIEF